MLTKHTAITTFLFDLDGVIRFFPEKETIRIEKGFGLPRRGIDRIAFSDDLLLKVTTGIITKKEWVRTIGKEINNMKAAIEWDRRPTRINQTVMAMVRKLRQRGVVVNLLTNGTNNLLNELEVLGIKDTFDRIFNSAELGVAKPSPSIYRLVLSYCGSDAKNIAYVDDNIDNVISARNLGINSFHYRNSRALKKWLLFLDSQLPGF